MGNCSGSKPSTPKPLTTVKIKQATDDASSENFKIIITGDAAIGKTSMLVRLCEGKFNSDGLTIGQGTGEGTATITVGNKKVKLIVADTAGQERFRTITSSFYRGSDGIIFAFDVNSLESFNNCHRWVKEAERYSDKVVGKIIVATKCDTDLGKRAVSYANASAFADGLDMPYFETSSKDNINILEAFTKLAEVIIEELDRDTL